MEVIDWLGWMFTAYLGFGILFSCWFVLKGVNRLDENMVSASFLMRLFLLPGSVVLWPILWHRIGKKTRIVK